MIIKCKICGGNIGLSEDKTFGTCEYCGSTMTLPKINDEQRAEAFNRGNHFRRIGDFDKALSLYEYIVREEPGSAEAHWCCAICRFGIEYVEDPTTYEWMPTCHRVSFDSFLDDIDYRLAIEYSDGLTRRQYQKDGIKIASVQKKILAASSSEKPFDIFICYKESEENGNRTKESVIAQDIYYQLTDSGYRVFFARLSLEEKVGVQYEPYIFAALNSAKVMIVIGTCREHFDSVWVKNEWSRFMAMMKKDNSKVLLPCYQDMNPYDLPEQLSVLQCYDMGKIGFIQDLIYGVGKIITNDVPVTDTNGVEALMKRTFLFLEDGEWYKADTYCEKILDIKPDYAMAYVGKLMASLKFSHFEDFEKNESFFDQNSNFEKALRFADDSLKNMLNGWIQKRDLKIKEKKFQIKEKYHLMFDSFEETRMNREDVQKTLRQVTECYKKGMEREKIQENIRELEKKEQEAEEEISVLERKSENFRGPFVGKEKKNIAKKIEEQYNNIEDIKKMMQISNKALLEMKDDMGEDFEVDLKILTESYAASKENYLQITSDLKIWAKELNIECDVFSVEDLLLKLEDQKSVRDMLNVVNLNRLDVPDDVFNIINRYVLYEKCYGNMKASCIREIKKLSKIS